jgi:hypothetical protein
LLTTQKKRPLGSGAQGPCDPATNNEDRTLVACFRLQPADFEDKLLRQLYVKNFWTKVKIAPGFFQNRPSILAFERFE